ncbi:unnamed protein product [Heligmosomoides polygyrus]|uniref:Uncharacterized protein n=1 Tax=Heligmosomoides polygyrus TaxID=6339 RepID=A0A183GBD0_HELPZ|nr:unnamed protein product [Heligmosomoides polygyrus]
MTSFVPVPLHLIAISDASIQKSTLSSRIAPVVQIRAVTD